MRGKVMRMDATHLWMLVCCGLLSACGTQLPATIPDELTQPVIVPEASPRTQGELVTYVGKLRYGTDANAAKLCGVREALGQKACSAESGLSE